MVGRFGNVHKSLILRILFGKKFLSKELRVTAERAQGDKQTTEILEFEGVPDRFVGVANMELLSFDVCGRKLFGKF